MFAAVVAGVAQVVDEHGGVFHTRQPRHGHGKLDHLGVIVRPVAAETLNAHLMKLPQPPGLGALAAEHGLGVAPAGDGALLRLMALQISAHHGGRAFGAQGHRVLVRLGGVFGEQVHLLVHDVAGGPHGAVKKLHRLEHGGLDFEITVLAKQVHARLLQLAQQAQGFVFKQIMGSAWNLGQCHGVDPAGRAGVTCADAAAEPVWGLSGTDLRFISLAFRRYHSRPTLGGG